MKRDADNLGIDQLIEAGLDEATSQQWANEINRICQDRSASTCWQELTQTHLRPKHPFVIHQLLYEFVYRNWDSTQGPAPAWLPEDEHIRSTNLFKMMAEVGIDSYREFHQWSVRQYELFWEKVIGHLAVRLKSPYQAIVDLSKGETQPLWLPGATLNITDSCFGADPDSAAIVYQDQAGVLKRISVKALQEMTHRVANGLRQAGYAAGDALGIIMPMTPETVAMYLGIVRAGCVVVSVADSFAPAEIEKRLQLGKVKAVFTQDVIRRGDKVIPLYEKVISAISATTARAVVLSIGQKSDVPLRDADLPWDTFLGDATEFESVSCQPRQPTNILFSSGTTGDPKAIPWTQTTPIKCAMDAYLHHNVQPGDVLAWPTNLGWMMGPWLIYAALMNRATIALYPDLPTQGGFGRFVQDAEVTMLGVVPSLVKAWKSTQCMRGCDWSKIKCFSSTGESSNADEMLYLMSLAGYKPVIEYCGGTEIGGGYVSGTMIQPAAPATFTTPSLGLDFVILDEASNEASQGEVFIYTPSIGPSTHLLNSDHHDVYYANTPQGPDGQALRRHGDQIERLPGGYFRAHGRVDDTMNLGGIKVSSAEIERVLNQLEAIDETAAIAVSEGAGPNQLVIYACLVPECQQAPADILEVCRTAIKQQLNPLFKVHDLVRVDRLPRTASNKVMRRELRGQYKKNDRAP
jgi:acetyl-CoA synthetase